jgi:trehalose-6-phosphatase
MRTYTLKVAMVELLEVGARAAKALVELAANSNNKVVVVSPRSCAALDAALGHLPNVVLAAEHGM